jgi:hypothetical protein
MAEAEKLEHEVEGEPEQGLRLHHHRGPRRERAMFAALGFVVGTTSTSTTSSSGSSGCS